MTRRQSEKLRGRPLDRLDAVSLIAAIIAGTPSLPGAACAGRPELFDDPFEVGRTDVAERLCAACPALDACGAWYRAHAPAGRPEGVVAGKYRRPRSSTTTTTEG